MTTPVQSTRNPIWTEEEKQKLDLASIEAEKIRSIIDTAVRVLSKSPQIVTTYPILSAYTSTLRGINSSENLPESAKVLELDKIFSEILEGKSIKENFEKLGKFLTPLLTLDLKKSTNEEIIDLTEVLRKWISYSKNPDFFNLLMNRNLLELFSQDKDLPSVISEEELREQLKSFEQCYEAASSYIMIKQVEVLKGQKHISTFDEAHVMAAYSFFPDPQFGYTNNPMGLGIAMRAIATTRNEKEVIRELLSDSDEFQEVLKEVKKMENLAEELMKTDDREIVKKLSVRILDEFNLKELPADVRLKTLKCLTEEQSEMSSYFKRKTMKFVESLFKKPKEKEQTINNSCLTQ